MRWWQVLMSEGVGAAIKALLEQWNTRKVQEEELKATTLMDPKRRQATQQAYTHWRRLVTRAGGRDRMGLDDALGAAQAWHDENRLYLAPEAREAFQNGIIFAANHARFLAVGDAELARRNWEDLIECGSVIERSMDEPLRGNTP